MVNPRYPHIMKITRAISNPDYNPSLDPGGEPCAPILVYHSICQNQINEAGDTVRKENVFFSDYTIYAPYPDYSEDDPFGDRSKAPEIKKMDKIEVYDGSRVINGQVSQYEPGNLGIRIWYDKE